MEILSTLLKLLFIGSAIFRGYIFSIKIGTLSVSDVPPPVSRTTLQITCNGQINLTVYSVVVQAAYQLLLYREAHLIAGQKFDVLVITDEVNKALQKDFHIFYIQSLLLNSRTASFITAYIPDTENDWCDSEFGQNNKTIVSLTGISFNSRPIYEFSISDAVFSVIEMIPNLDHLVLMVEDHYAMVGDEIKSKVATKGVQVTYYQAHLFTSDLNTIIALETIHTTGKKYILILASLSSIQYIFQQVDIYEQRKGKKFTLSLTTRWMTVVPERDESKSMIQEASDYINNIAVITLPATDNMREISEYLSLSPCHTIYLYTLVWKPEGRRLSLVTYLNSRCVRKTNRDIFPNVHFGLNNRTLNVVVNTYEPFIYKTTLNKKTVYTGMCMDLLKELSRLMNFSYTIVQPQDGEWGDVNTDGNWTGIIGELQNEKADISVAPVSATAKRKEVVSFSYPFYIEHTSVILKPSDGHENNWFTYFKPFSSHVLVCVLVSLALGTIVLFAVEKWNPFYERHPNTPVQNFSGVFWYLYGAMLTQGGERLPGSLAGRKFISFWWLFCIMLVAIYSGNLMAFLTISRVNVPFDTLAGMVAQDEYKWGTLGGSAYTHLFKNATTEIYNQIGKGLARFRMTDNDVISSIVDVHKTKVTQGQYAYVGDMIALQSFMKANNCSLHIIKEKFLPLYYSVALPMNSSLRDVISKEIIRITESGLVTMWMNKWLGNDNQCSHTPSSSVAAAKILSLIDVQAAFYVVCIGIVASCCVLLFERLIRLFIVKTVGLNRR